MDRVQKVDSSDDWGARHPFLEYSRQDSENAVLSVRVPLDHGQPKAPEPLIDHRPALKDIDAQQVSDGPPQRAGATPDCCQTVFVNNATCPGLFRGPAHFSLSFWSKIYVGLALLEALILVGVSVGTIVVRGADEHSYLYSILAIVCLLSFVYYSLDSVYTENAFQLLYSLLTSVILSMFVVVSVFKVENDKDLGPVWQHAKFVVLVVKISFQLAYLGLAYPVKQSFGYYLYKMASASVELQELFKGYLAFLSLLKFDMLLSVIVLMMLNFTVLTKSAVVIIGLVMVLFSIFWAWMGWYAITRESVCALIPFAALSIVKFAYVVYNLYSLYKHPSDITFSLSYPQYVSVAAAATIVRGVLLWYTYKCYKCFGKGLKTRVFESANGTGLDLAFNR